MRTSVHAILRYLAIALAITGQEGLADEARPRARDLGLVVGVLASGPLDAITDVAGVKVGQATRIEGDSVRTGVTVILPHGGNLFEQKVPGAVFVGNGFGKLAGSTQVNELGEIETPIALTSTLSVPRVADAILSYTLSLPGNEKVRSINPLVAETNDGQLNDGRGRHIRGEDVLYAINHASSGPVAEGTVGAGTGTVAFGFKGGIGTASRHLPPRLGNWTVGVLVQSNFPGILTMGGAPVGQELGQFYLKDLIAESTEHRRGSSDLPAAACNRCSGEPDARGSIVMVIATDAPADHRNLMRMASRAMLGLARTGAAGVGESGDYAIAFSTATSVRITSDARSHPAASSPLPYQPIATSLLSNDAMSPLFLAVVEATEEAIYNSLLRATTVEGNGRRVSALPLAPTIAILKKHGALRTNRPVEPHP